MTEIPPIGLGTFQLQGEACERAVREALDLGYRHVDTAEGYENEDQVGRALSGVDRESVFLTTKVWREHLRREELRRRCEASLARLGTDYLDLYLIHWPNSDIPIEETVEGFRQLRDEGKIRAWGVSNFTETHLEETLEIEAPVTNQVELHPYFPQRALGRYCLERGIPLTAYSPLCRGEVLGDPVLLEVGEAHGASPVQVALAWILQRGHRVIPKASSREHLEENLAAGELRLTPEDVERVGARPRGERLFDFDWSEFDR